MDTSPGTPPSPGWGCLYLKTWRAFGSNSLHRMRRVARYILIILSVVSLLPVHLVQAEIINTVTANGTFGGSPVTSPPATEIVDVVDAAPSLSVVKTADTAGPVNAGDIITYTFVVTNTGNVTITNARVDDTHNGSNAPLVPGGETLTTDTAPLLDSTDAAANGVWDVIAPGDVITFTATYTVTQTDVDILQ